MFRRLGNGTTRQILPPETTKASYLLLSAHRQRPIVAVTPYCDTSQCAFPTPEGPFIKLYRLPNKAISNKNRALRTANWLCIHADCIIRVVPRAKLDGLNLGLVPGCCILCCHKLPGATLISFCSSFILPGHARELPIGHVKDGQQFSRRTLPKHGKGT